MRVVLWDFDGTLAYRPGMWGRELAGALAEVLPDCTVHLDDIRPHLRQGFPWHEPNTAHPELATSQLWWAHIEGLLSRALQAVGIEPAAADTVARETHRRVLDPSPYVVFEDTFPVLAALSQDGWRHVILSNHVPELPQIAQALGIAERVAAVLSSANIGYDKPHPQAYRAALAAAGDPRTVWMVGDNPTADVHGPEAVGIPAILVRNSDAIATRRAADLWEARAIILAA